MKGKISQWKDDKGFGFITSDNGQKIFFHISSLTTKGRRPKIGESVKFASITDNQNRLKATSVAIEGLPKESKYQSHDKVEPKTKSGIDYILIFTLIISVVFTAYMYLKSISIESSIIFGIPAVIAFVLLGRQKKPKSTSFNCTKCKKNERYDMRTINAWNRGFTHLYCNTCHIQWLKNKPSQEKNYSTNNNGGCLGAVTLIIGTTLFSGYSVMNWFMQTVF